MGRKFNKSLQSLVTNHPAIRRYGNRDTDRVLQLPMEKNYLIPYVGGNISFHFILKLNLISPIYIGFQT
jgi:hypothetical protein